jgi:RNA polymerase sigma factor (sigma-70 family)
VVAIVAAGTLDSMVADQRRGPEQLIEVAEAAADLDAAMRSLKPDQRRALTLLALGYSYAEIAERSGWTRTKVNRSLTEGRARLRGLLDRGGENS